MLLRRKSVGGPGSSVGDEGVLGFEWRILGVLGFGRVVVHGNEFGVGV